MPVEPACPWKQSTIVSINKLLLKTEAISEKVNLCEGDAVLNAHRAVEAVRALKSAVNALPDDYVPQAKRISHAIRVGCLVDIRDRYRQGPRGYGNSMPRLDRLTVLALTGRMVRVKAIDLDPTPELIINKSHVVLHEERPMEVVA